MGPIRWCPMSAAPAEAVALARGVIETAGRHLAAGGDVDANQVAAYDLAHAAAAVETAAAVVDYGQHGEVERRIAAAFVADAVHDVATRLLGREPAWGVEPGALDGAMDFVREHRSAEFLASLAGEEGSRQLDADFEMVQDTFRRFAEDKVRPVAEHVHRENGDIPEDVIAGLAELGTFGLSIPEEYGGFSTGGEGEYLAMVVATEELSRGSLGVGGSLITRPEILARALVAGRDRGAEAGVAAEARQRRGDGGRRRDGTRLRLRQRGDHDDRHPRRRRLRDQRREDVVHVRRAGRRPHADGPHRPGPQQGAPRAVAVRRSEGARRRPQLPVRSARRRTDGGSGHRHPRVPRHALLRGELRRLARARPPTSSAARPGSARASTCRWPVSTTAGSRRRRARSA